jgi:four helix bundle protein
VGKQLIRSATSVAANYRAACRAKSAADFIAKMGIVEEEADESLFWLEVIEETGLMKKERIEDLQNEADQIVALTVSSINTARGHKR